jgi:hypothetical protein
MRISEETLEFPVDPADVSSLDFVPDPFRSSLAHAQMLLPMMLPEILEKRNALMNPEPFVLD